MGITSNWNDASNKLIYKVSTVIPLTILLALLLLALIVDLVFFGVSNNLKISSD
jgi:hypothetical protein